MKKSFLFFLIAVIFFSLAVFILGPQWAFAAEREEGRLLEISYPGVGGAEGPETVTTPVPEYVKYIFNFAIWISGLIALMVLILGGVKYLTSAGNIEGISDAKNQITAAVLGIVILLGSYLILITINPDLVIFHLKRLRPIISTLPPGVLVCKNEVGVMRAWGLMEEHKYDNPDIDRQEEIKEELDAILNDITEQCYTVFSKSNIRGDFDNKIKVVYFIPFIWIKGDYEYETEYGAILYEDRNYGGMSHPLYEHLKDPSGGWRPYQTTIDLSPFEISSIKPFQLIYKPDENWKVQLFQKPNFNKGFSGLIGRDYNFTQKPGEEPGWWGKIDLEKDKKLVDEDGNYKPPESIIVDGDFLAILSKKTGESDSFFKGYDSNLLDNENIVDWKLLAWCPSQWIKGKLCAVAAATTLIIIAAHPY